MMQISEALAQIQDAVYGHEVRQAIHDGIKRAYDDASSGGNTNMEVSMARGEHSNLNGRLDDINSLLNKLHQGLPRKIDKDSNAVTMSDLSQGVKEAMTGGSVAVVGHDGVNTENIVNRSVTAEKTDFIEGKENLFKIETITRGYNIAPNTGQLRAYDGYNVSDYIPISKGVEYWFDTVRVVAIFDTNKNIQTDPYYGFDISPRKPFNFIAPVNGYIRLSIHDDDLEGFIANSGSKKLSEENLGLKLSDRVGINKHNIIDNSDIVAFQNGSEYFVKYQYNKDINEAIIFGQLGINKIIHPTKILRENNIFLSNNFEAMKLRYELSTDWISPYSNIKAAGGSTAFTGTVGGNHGTSGGSGFPTAKNLSSKLYVDGELVENDTYYRGHSAKLIVINQITASNRLTAEAGGDYSSLIEIVVYTITKNNIEVSVTLEAQEDLTISGYVGLQMTPRLINNGDIYFGDKAEVHKTDSTRSNSKGLPFDGETMVIKNNEDLVATYTNRNVGIGNLDVLGSSPVHYISVNNKMYSHLVGSGASLPMKAGETVNYSGGYTFMSPLKCDGAEVAWINKYNGRDFYNVIFFNAVDSTYLKVLEKDLGKEIEVVDVDDTITTDNFIGGNGLRLSSTGFGQVSFRVK